MVKVSVDEDCGNAPKKQLVKDFLIATATLDFETAADMLAENAALEIAGHTQINDKESIIQLLTKDETRGNLSELAIHNILSHGNKCAANGILNFGDGGEVAFCYIYTFTSHSKDAKIKDITAYLIGDNHKDY